MSQQSNNTICGIYEIWIGSYFYQGSSKNIKKRIAAKEDPEYYLENWSSIFPDSITTALFSLGVKSHEK